MPLRRVAVGALVFAVLGSLGSVAFAAASPDPKPAIKHLPAPAHAKAGKQRSFDPRTLLVRFKSGASAATRDKTLKSHGARSLGTVPGTGYLKVHTDGPAADALRGLRRNSAVQSVTLDFRRHISATPNDEFYAGYQSYLNTVRLPLAWDRTKGSTSQVIAVVDTGVNTGHEDLVGRTVPGSNVVTPGTAPADDNGHGSMVAGIAAANTNNGVGIAGVAWTGRVMPVKVLDANGSGWDSDIATGITWAADHGAKIINLSLGGPDDSPALHDAIAYATGKGAVVVVAAGNDGNDTPQYPAAYPEVLAVGATDAGGNLTDFSSYGDWIDVAAPGFGIVSTGLGQDYYQGDGTSFAAPIVSGVAALVRTKFPTYTPAQVVSRIKITARDAGPRGIDPYYGYGVVDANYAVGGAWGTEFPQRALGAGEPNDVPDRATAFSAPVSGTIAMEGDVDWYRYDSPGPQAAQFTVTPPAFSASRPQNLDPVLTVYNKDLKQIAEVDTGGPGAPEALPLNLDAGSYYVAVRNYNGAADTRAYTLAVAPTGASPFGPAYSISVGSWPEAVAVGDMTGDGRADVVMTTSFYFDPVNDYKLFVFAQNADGTLAAPVSYPTALQYADSAGLALLDADGDGHLDVALATDAGVQIFRQTGAGVLQDAGLLPGTTGARQVVAADMDADGDADLVTTGPSGTRLLTHQPDGTFVPAAVSADSSGEVEVGDVDGNGRPDVVEFSGTTVRVYHQTDTGWNRTDHATNGSTYASGIEVADVNGDGRADIVASTGGNAPASKISVLTQNATGGLNSPVLYAVRDIPEPVEAADITGDGRTDVVTAHGGWNTLSLLPQTSGGTLGTPLVSSIPYASHYNTQGLALGDINGDGRVDAVIADYNSGLDVITNGTTTLGEQAWVRGVSPADFTTGLGLGTAPSVTFARTVDPASVTSSTVRLVNGRTGADVPAAVGFDAGTGIATVTPAAALQDNTPYRIVVSGLRDTGAADQVTPFSTTFRTVDLAPPPVTGLTATGGLRSATISWTKPAITDLDQVIVRMAAGTTAPASPTAGTAVYAGTGSSAAVSGLAAGTTYTFRVWIRDRSGKLSTAPTAVLRGTAVSIATSTTALTYGGGVTVTGLLTRPDTGAGIGGATVQLYGRRVGASTFTLLGTVTSGSTGALSLRHVPAWSVDYEWIYRGSPVFIGVYSSLKRVGVRTAVAATLSKTSFLLGGSVTLSGSVAPSHAGQTVYLQRLVSGSWTSVASKALSSTSTYSFTIKPTARGIYYYRVYKPADTDHLAGYSGSRRFTVS